MNLKYCRISLNESYFSIKPNGERAKKPTFAYSLSREDLLKAHVASTYGTKFLSASAYEKLKTFRVAAKFNSVGFSTIYVSHALTQGRNGIQPGDLVYFKANNERGVNSLGRTEESMGSCEDVAEVLCHYLIRNMSSALGDKAVLKTTPYDFAELHDHDFWEIVAKKTARIVQSDRLYGCISKNCVAENGEIIHGNALLAQIFPGKEVSKSSNNTIANYEQATALFQQQASRAGQQVVIDPICSRYNANTIFLDYFTSNNDRHYKNVNYQKVSLPDGRFVLEPLAILDNGGAFSMQSQNCQKLYEEQSAKLERFDSNKLSPAKPLPFNPFPAQMDFSAGKDLYKDSQIQEMYDKNSGFLPPVYEVVLLASQNAVLYQDLKNMYQLIDPQQALADMKTDLKFPSRFLPGLDTVIPAAINFKRMEISQTMAQIMGVEFNPDVFNQNQNAYIDQFESFVKEDELTCHIATDEEIQAFNTEFRPELVADSAKQLVLEQPQQQ